MYRFGRRPAREDVADLAGLSTHPAEQPMPLGDLYEHTALRATRRRCIDCSGASVKAVTTCNFGPDHATAPCSLHAHRLRIGSKRRTGTELEFERERLRQRLQVGEEMQTEPNSAG
jgi:hypothetical protein